MNVNVKVTSGIEKKKKKKKKKKKQLRVGLSDVIM